ncbi:MAG: glycosyltransferase family 39 protein, partial [Armatimonadota bacterium]|nr:glycosyltransferase family 39 protein [Armatimonadota bacterium]
MLSAMHATEPSNQASRPRSDRRRWIFPLLLLVLCATLFFWRLGITPLDDFDETYYAEGAREMLERGDLGTPYYNGRPFLLKPILIYWLIAAAFRIFGTTEFAARSVSAFFAAVIVLLTYCFAGRTIGRRAG